MNIPVIDTAIHTASDTVNTMVSPSDVLELPEVLQKQLLFFANEILDQNHQIDHAHALFQVLLDTASEHQISVNDLVIPHLEGLDIPDKYQHIALFLLDFAGHDRLTFSQNPDLDEHLYVFLKTLLDQGLDVNLKNTEGFNALIFATSFACGYGDLKTLELLIESGADLDVPFGKKQNTPLHYAAQIGVRPVLDLLLNMGANPLIKNALGQMPLDLMKEALELGVTPHQYAYLQEMTAVALERQTLNLVTENLMPKATLEIALPGAATTVSTSPSLCVAFKKSI